jgi:hypothetical protein
MQSQLNRALHKLQKSDPQYTYLIFFFIAFSVFTLFIIRPSLVTAFSLLQRERTLTEVNTQYEDTISRILATQSDLEQIQTQIPLIDAAVPKSPRLNAVLEDIKSAAQSSDVTIDSMNINKTSLVYTNSSNEVQSVHVVVFLNTTFEKYLEFQRILYSQKRIKNIVTSEFLKQGGDGESGQPTGNQLKIQLEIAAYYL